MTRICFDYGHGGLDPGAVYKDRKEKDDNLEIGRLVAKTLRLYGVEIDETRSGDETMTLGSRCRFENKKKYDYFISFHRNAYKPEEARGVETYIYINGNPRAKSLSLKIQKAIVDQGFIDRGVKMADFKVLRETLAPALLIELGFIDNTLDNQLFLDKNKEIGESISRSILEHLGIKYKGPDKELDKEIMLNPESKVDLYRVIAGSFKKRENAERRIKDLKDAGFDCYMI
nr:N-acetylmuramoyl-L-alanine amidase [Tissierella sp.]